LVIPLRNYAFDLILFVAPASAGFAFGIAYGAPAPVATPDLQDQA
jgi:hypothetical protein